MDHNLDDLNLDESIGVDFEEAVTIVEANSNISVVQEDQPMEYGSIEEQPVLMETEREEVIEFMGDEFVLNSEYVVPDDDHITDKSSLSLESGIDGNTIVESIASTSSNSSLLKDNITEFQFDQESLIETVVSTSLDMPSVSKQPMFVRIQNPQYVNREKASIPRPIPIAPKPSKKQVTYSIVKPIPIAPKQTPAPPNNPPGYKKLQFLTQVCGKQIMMMPSAGQKFKMVHNAGGIRYLKEEESDELSTQPGQTSKPLKVIVQGKGSDFSNAPAVLTKVVQQQPAATLVSLNKSVPLINKVANVSNKMVNVPIQLRPKHMVAVKSPVKILPTPSIDTKEGGKKVLIPTSPARKVVLKAVRRPPRPTPIHVIQTSNSMMNVTSGPARTKLHQVHIPGKGVKYIRLTTENNTPEVISEPTSGKAFVVTYHKGNVVPIAEDNVNNSAPCPPLVVTSGKLNKLIKNQNAPVKITSMAKKITRSPQSLLAPIIVQSEIEPQAISDGEERTDHDRTEENLIDCKEDLKKALTRDNMDVRRVTSQNTETSCTQDNDAALTKPESYRLVVNPETFARHQSFSDSDFQIQLSPEEPPDPTEAELKLRARKACNCHKSLCLKLYCECFANGEFCKDCNCMNCHNTLSHDEARRNAILGCLERNPDAFRPKIGKARSSAGPSTVRRHNKGCNCKRSGCLKNYCECYEAKIACTPICKCVGCRNVEDGGDRARKISRLPRIMPKRKQPCRLLTSSVIEAAVQCLLAAATPHTQQDAVRAVLTEYARCMHAVIAAARHAQAIT